MAKIKKKHLIRIGYEPGEALRAALVAMADSRFAKKGRETKMGLLQAVLADPEKYRRHEVLNPVVVALAGEENQEGPAYPSLNDTALPYEVYGLEGIEAGAQHQMAIAARLPIARAGALMPDAHQGYGLPIGGVLATEGAIIPYAVGVDIGCRMALTVYNIKASYIDGHHNQLKRELIAQTTFGSGKGPEKPMSDAVLDRTEFKEIAIVKQLKDKAWRQIGSSGGGNHFVEFGEVKLTEDENEWGLAPGTYMALLTHSGSRGLGAGIANYYTKVAMETCKLPREARHLAWLDIESEAGQEYWRAMNLAGDYASACHDHIHRRIAKAIGEKPAFKVENHHNFAWKDRLEDGTEVFVHRKGATPAGKGVLGIIPGSMTAPGFIVRGKGESRALKSASHGAGRVLSRSKAKRSLTKSAMNKVLREHKVTLIGGDLDEAPMAYKDIHAVMAHQRGLVDIVGTFQPRIVRMAD